MKEDNLWRFSFIQKQKLPSQLKMPPLLSLKLLSPLKEKKEHSQLYRTETCNPGNRSRIMVPMFINQGEVIKVDTRDRSYSERVRQ